ncbi:MAG: hypothetical protein PHC66_02625 [Candidatus Nanoarchaeia archaeon]|nr:hypothetical protein [Candidatus Nanoarchaeia archaeon]MDD5239681.1 hypothetical protein [Candidatus Nanoarchaeia archaeon]
MERSELEEIVRSKLIEQRTEILVKFVSKDDTYKQKVTEAVKEYVDIIFDNLVEVGLEDLDKDEKKEMKQELNKHRNEFRKEHLKELEKRLSPRNLKQSMYDIAKKDYSSLNETKEKLDGVYAVLQECETEKSVIQQYKAAAKSILKNNKQKDLFIKELTNMIEKDEKLDKVLELNTQYEVIRKMYPTADAYRTSQIYARKQINDYFEKLGKIESANKQGNSPTLEAQYKFLQKLMKIDEKMHLAYLEKQIKEIYGTKG